MYSDLLSSGRLRVVILIHIIRIFELIKFKGGIKLNEKLLRVGTTYIPVLSVKLSTEWYLNKLGAELCYQDKNKTILNFANQSIFLVKSKENQSSNFFDISGNEHFSLTFEVNGLNALETIHQEFKEKQIRVGVIEERGHAGKNFVFFDLNGNKFDVWSELSPDFKEKYQYK